MGVGNLSDRARRRGSERGEAASCQRRHSSSTLRPVTASAATGGIIYTDFCTARDKFLPWKRDAPSRRGGDAGQGR